MAPKSGDAGYGAKSAVSNKDLVADAGKVHLGKHLFASLQLVLADIDVDKRDVWLTPLCFFKPQNPPSPGDLE